MARNCEPPAPRISLHALQSQVLPASNAFTNAMLNGLPLLSEVRGKCSRAALVFRQESVMPMQVGRHLPEAAWQDKSAVRTAMAPCGRLPTRVLLSLSAGLTGSSSPLPCALQAQPEGTTVCFMVEPYFRDGLTLKRRVCAAC